jgi:hypothetical protein
MCEATQCQTRPAAGINLTTHVSPCPDAPIDVCADCGYDVVRSEAWVHEDCDINITAVIEEALAEAAREEVMIAA